MFFLRVEAALSFGAFNQFSTRRQGFTCVRLYNPYLTHFPTAHYRGP